MDETKETMEKKRPLNDLLRSTMDKIHEMVDTNTIVGEPIATPDGVTLIPVSKLSFGVAGGGTEFTTKKQPAGDNSFGGGSGASAKLEPVAFLVVREGGVKLLPVAPPPATTADRVIEAVPEVVDKVTNFIKDQQDRKEKTADLAD